MLLQIIRIKNGYNWILFQILSCNGVLRSEWAWAAAYGEPMRRGLSQHRRDQTPPADACRFARCVSCSQKASVILRRVSPGSLGKSGLISLGAPAKKRPETNVFPA
jgi:hypothetical protein